MGRRPEPALPRIWDRIVVREHFEAPGGPWYCWDWQGRKNKDGYAYLSIRGKEVRLHRWLYRRFRGELPESRIGPLADTIVLDHLCRNRCCVNPWHLELVTQKENIERGTNYQRNKDTCAGGHPFDETNTEWRQRGNGKRYRRCRTCHREQERTRASRAAM